MVTLSKKLCGAIAAMALLFVATASTANAQSFRGRLSNGEKAGYIAGGAAAGAVIGGLLGGGKGAVIGGLLGAGGGTGYVYYRDQRDNDRSYGYRGYDDHRYNRDYRSNGYFGDSRTYERRDRDGDRDDRNDNRYRNNVHRGFNH